MIKVDKNQLPGTALFVLLIGAVLLMTGLTDWQQRAPSEMGSQVEVAVKNTSAENETLLVKSDHESDTQLQ